MPPVNIAESSDKVVEINHHLVRLDTTHSLQRHHYLTDWSNPRELFTTLLHPHGSHHRTSDSHFAESQPGLVTNSDSSDLLFLPSTSGGSHHEFNGTHHGGASSDLTGLSTSAEDVEEESLIVIYALFLPLLVTLIFILLIALYVRKMRRSSSMLEVDDRERYALDQLGLPGDLSKRSAAAETVKALTTSFTMDGETPIPPPRRSKKKLAYLTRSISMLGISSGSDKKVVAAPPTAQFYGQEPRKRWNTSGFLNSTNSLSVSSEDAVASDQGSCTSSAASEVSASSADQVSTASSSENDVEGVYADSGVTSSFATSSSSGASSTSGSEEVEEGGVPPVAARRKKHRKNHIHHHHHHHQHQENRSHSHHHHHHQRRDPYVSALEEGPIPVVVEDNYYKIEAMLQAMEKDGSGLESKRSSAGGLATSSKKSFGGKMLDIVNIPKRIKQSSADKKRFNVYTIPMETREQLKQIYVY